MYDFAVGLNVDFFFVLFLYIITVPIVHNVCLTVLLTL